MPTALMRICLFVLAFALTVSCSSGSGPDSASSPTGSNANASLNKDDYPVFPDPDAGADPAVPAEQGGKGFTGEGWETNTDFGLIGDPRAVKGGLVRDYSLAFPGTFRMGGPEWNTTTNAAIQNMVYEPLLTLHPTSLQYVPTLATHWQISPDKLTFRFRIDPNARFSDGTPVTAEDVVVTWVFLTDKTLQDPSYYTELTELEKPVAESKYIVSVKAKKLAWLNFDRIATMIRIFPAHILKTVNGAAYLKDYNFKLLPGSGPYVLNESDIKKGTSFALRRRNDHWAEKYRLNVGLYNFDEVRTVIVRDQNLAFEMFKKGDLDYYYVNRSQVWVEELDDEGFQQGLRVKKKVFNNYPSLIQFFAFNTRRQPWDDIRVRKALTLLFDRELLIEKLFYKEYLPINSFFPGTPYENPNNPKNLYNPQEALKLLAEAGWKDRDAQGRLTRNGKPLVVELMYRDKGSEPSLTPYQEELRRLGIGLNLRLTSSETAFKLQMERQFDVTLSAWASSNIFPTPTTSYHSTMADQLNTTNISGFKDKRIDALCEEYDVTFDPQRRTEILRELDNILVNQYHYIMQWYAPAQRLAYWNKFGMPQGTLSRIGDYEGALAPGVAQLWWVDGEKQSRFEQAMRDPSLKLDIPPVEDRHWLEYGEAK